MYVKELDIEHHQQKFIVKEYHVSDSHKAGIIAIYGDVYLEFHYDEYRHFVTYATFVVRNLKGEPVISSITLSGNTIVELYEPKKITSHSDGFIWEYNNETKLWTIVGEY